MRGSIFAFKLLKLSCSFLKVGDAEFITDLKVLKFVATARTTIAIAANTAMTMPAGDAIAAIAVLSTPPPAESPEKPLVAILANLPRLVNAPPTLPTIVTTLPKISKAGPTAAAIVAHLTICLRCAGSILLNLSSNSVILSIKGTTAPDKASPRLYLKTSKDDFNFSTAPPGPLISASAIFFEAPVAPSMLSL